MITQERLKELLDYDPETGVFTRRQQRGRGLAGMPAGNVSSLGYVYITLDRHRCLAHRLVWLLVTGSFPKEFVDHINGDTSDNRVENLRGVDNAQNLWNRGTDSNNTTGVKGVRWHSGHRHWQGRVYARGTCHHVGTFHTLQEAEAAVRAARTELHGEYANHGQTANCKQRN